MILNYIFLLNAGPVFLSAVDLWRELLPLHGTKHTSRRFSVHLTNKTIIYAFKNKRLCVHYFLEDTLVVNIKGVLDVSPCMFVVISHNSF